jgi:hypothetical protein
MHHIFGEWILSREKFTGGGLVCVSTIHSSLKIKVTFILEKIKGYNSTTI